MGISHKKPSFRSFLILVALNLKKVHRIQSAPSPLTEGRGLPTSSLEYCLQFRILSNFILMIYIAFLLIKLDGADKCSGHLFTVYYNILG